MSEEKYTKKQKRRINQLRGKLVAEQERKKLYEELGSVSLDNGSMKLLVSSKDFNKKTKKSELKRAYQEEKAGLARSNPALQLYTPHQIRTDVVSTQQAVAQEEDRRKSLFQFIGTLPVHPKPDRQEPLKKRIKKKFVVNYDDDDESDENDRVHSTSSSDSGSEEEGETMLNTNASNSNANANDRNETNGASLKKKLPESANVNNATQDEPPKKKVKIENGRSEKNKKNKKVVQDMESDSLDGIDDGEMNVARGGTDSSDSSDSDDDSGDDSDESSGEMKLDEAKGRNVVGQEGLDDAGIAPEEYQQRLRDKLANVDHVRGMKSQVKSTGRINEGFVESMVEESGKHIVVETNEEGVLKAGKKFYIHIERTPEIQEQRQRLPIIMEEQKIMECIDKNDVVIVCGQTGSGKTTQVPQFLYEAGYGSPNSDTPGMIGVTEPRRVAAVSVAARVSAEMNCQPGTVVGHQIRYDSAVSNETRVKFMTDGILLREIEEDFLLSKYSALLLDEAHERSLNTDILIGLLARIVPLRRELYQEYLASDRSGRPVSPLKLVIMSATLRVSDFTENRKMFQLPPPVITVQARQYPVTIKWNKRTPLDTEVVDAAYAKVCKIHQENAPGGILVFMVGQADIEQLCKKLRNYKPKKQKEDTVPVAGDLNEEEAGMDKAPDWADEGKERADGDPPQSVETKSATEAVDVKESKDGKEAKEVKEVKVHRPQELLVLPFYSMLPPEQQMRVFQSVDHARVRLVVVATNIAETSITIPNVTYVVDTGRVKQKLYDSRTGMERFEVQWTSKASADQRAGRSGRTGAGWCYRLYSSAAYHQHFPQFSPPEILQTPIDNVVLSMKNMGIGKVDSFPFPTSPPLQAIRDSLQSLHYLGALGKDHCITELGQAMARIPVTPRLAKMLLLSAHSKMEKLAIAMVAALSVGDPFIHVHIEETLDDDKKKPSSKDDFELKLKKDKAKSIKQVQSQWKSGISDVIAWLHVIIEYEMAEVKELFCSQNFIHWKLMKEIHELRHQLTRVYNSVSTSDVSADLAKKDVPSREEKSLLREILTAGLIDRCARRIPMTDSEGNVLKNRYKFQTCISNSVAFIHSSSVLYTSQPEYIVYANFTQSTIGEKCHLNYCSAISNEWLYEFGAPLLSFSDPLEMPPPRYSLERDTVTCFVDVFFGPHVWPLPRKEVAMEYGVEKLKWFAVFLLEGQVFSKLKAFQEYLRSSPRLVIKQWEHGKMVPTVQPLITHKIDSRQKLIDKWASEPTFYLDVVLKWMDPSVHQAIRDAWPPTA